MERAERERINFVDEAVRKHLDKIEDEAEVQRRLQMIEDFGNDTYKDSTVFVFPKKFTWDGTTYTYAVLKANGKWYMTGRADRSGITWRELAIWLVSGQCPTTAEDLELMVEANRNDEKVDDKHISKTPLGDLHV